MKNYLLLLLVLIAFLGFGQNPVFKNPGITSEHHFIFSDHLDSGEFVKAVVDISLVQNGDKKYYSVVTKEGDAFLNEMELNFEDLTSISEKRTDLKCNSLIENYSYQGNNKVYYYNRKKNVDKIFTTSDNNIYSRFGYFVSFQGFPFALGNTVYFKTFMYEYGDALTMKLSCVDMLKVQVTAGTFDCYKLELSVSGWQSFFVPDKFYLYFDKNAPHQFIKYEEKSDDGKWIASELVKMDV